MAESTKTTEGATTEAPETKATEKTAEKATGAKKGSSKTTEGATTGGKVYNFTATNKYLSCVALGVQFVDGKATTDKLEIAKELVKLDGVNLVED